MNRRKGKKDEKEDHNGDASQDGTEKTGDRSRDGRGDRWKYDTGIGDGRMNAKWIYRMLSGVYDLLDVVYFRDAAHSPRTAALAKINEGERVLDLCTGTGTTALSVAKKKPGTKIVGVDLSKDMLRVAAEKRRKSCLKNVSLSRMDATALKFKTGCFDKILISLILHEMEEELAAKIINEAARVLKDKGEIIVTEWEPSDKLFRKILFSPIHYLEPKPYKSFIRKDLYAYFARFGLEITSYEHCDYTKVIVLKKAGR